TPQSTRLYSVIDALGNETKFGYVTSDANLWGPASRTNRAGDPATTFAYTSAPATTTVAMPLSRTWTYTFDNQGRVTAIQDPVSSAQTTVDWTTDNKVQKVTEPTGQF